MCRVRRFSLITDVLVHRACSYKSIIISSSTWYWTLLDAPRKRSQSPSLDLLYHHPTLKRHAKVSNCRKSRFCIEDFDEKKLELETRQKIVLCVTWWRRRKRLCTLHGVRERENAIHATMTDDSWNSRHGPTSDIRTLLITQANNWRLWKLTWQRVLAEIGARVIAKRPNLDMRRESGLARGKVAVSECGVNCEYFQRLWWAHHHQKIS